LIDLVWEVRRELGTNEPIWVISGYRSPATNAMLRRRSSGVAQFSQHMLGKALDFYIPGVSLERLREAGLRAQRGGVGFYPSSNFVHMDTGSVRHWPRMPEAQLARVLAKGPLTASRGSDRTTQVASAMPLRNPSAKLFGGAEEEDHEAAPATAKVAAARSDTQRTVAAAAKPEPAKAEKAVDKPAERVASVPMPVARPG